MKPYDDRESGGIRVVMDVEHTAADTAHAAGSAIWHGNIGTELGGSAETDDDRQTKQKNLFHGRKFLNQQMRKNKGFRR